MTSKLNVFEDGLILSGIGVSLANIQTILSIILLTINLIWLSIKICSKIGKAISDGKLTDEEIEDIEKELDKLDDLGGGENANKHDTE